MLSLTEAENNYQQLLQKKERKIAFRFRERKSCLNLKNKEEAKRQVVLILTIISTEYIYIYL